MTYGRSFGRHLKRFNLPLAYIEWAGIAQNRAEWYKRATKPPFIIGKPFLRRQGATAGGQRSRNMRTRRAARPR